ncbi:hypothetical protein [Xylella fastidiosa]|uniref:hypothetical protein n=1 Tax=Xylella fastidiosa TaxID=2371 RepID=UPI0021CC7F75|nr:hypothetical protein [Xylella fastidiosa]
MSGMSPEDQVNISALCRGAERLEEDALYSSKGHFNAEAIWVRRKDWLGVPATALGVIAGAVLVKSQLEWVSVFTLLASLRTGLLRFLRPKECAVMLPDSFWLFGRRSRCQSRRFNPGWCCILTAA